MLPQSGTRSLVKPHGSDLQPSYIINKSTSMTNHTDPLVSTTFGITNNNTARKAGHSDMLNELLICDLHYKNHNKVYPDQRSLNSKHTSLESMKANSWQSLPN